MANEEINLEDLIHHETNVDKEIRRLQKQIAEFTKNRRKYQIVYAQNRTIKFGLIGDTQLGSLYERLDALDNFYRFCAHESVRDVFHCGDVLDGWRVYRGQEFELYAIGYAAQKKVFREKYPKIKGITTHFITGNHDASLKKLAGVDVGHDLEKERPDFHFLGEDYAEMVLRNCAGFSYKIALVHPDGGTAYALSYHPQKYIESLAGGTKPNLVAFGHYHKAELIPEYRNVVGIQVGTFQSQTPFMKRRGVAAHIGGWIVEVMPEGRLTSRVRAEWVSFYEPQN